MASGHMNRVKRPDTWLHRPMLQNVKKVLANPEPSTHDHRTAYPVRCLNSAEADVRPPSRKSGFDPRRTPEVRCRALE